MSVTPFKALACPLDGTPLHCTSSARTCASGQSLEYTDLLPLLSNERSYLSSIATINLAA